MIIELLTHKYLTFEEDWNFNILAHEDLLIWIDNLWQLKNKQELKKPNFNIVITNDKKKFQPTNKAINIDFSLFKPYTDNKRTEK